MPLMRRVPKRGFNQTMFREVASVVGVGDLERMEGKTVTPKSLAAAGLIRDERGKVKILANGAITKPVEVSGCSVSGAARQAIIAAGGSVE